MNYKEKKILKILVPKFAYFFWLQCFLKYLLWSFFSSGLSAGTSWIISNGDIRDGKYPINFQDVLCERQTSDVSLDRTCKSLELYRIIIEYIFFRNHSKESNRMVSRFTVSSVGTLYNVLQGFTEFKRIL